MKKILALVVAFALCFTAIGGCLTTFAADAAADAALAVNAPVDLVAYNPAEIAVVVSGTGYTAYAAQELKVSFPDALTLKSIDGIDEFDAVGQANYKVATADGVTTVTLVQETPGDTFELTFKLGLAAANQSGYIRNYTVTASAEVGTDADDPVLYTVAEASDSFDVDCSHGAVKLASDATGHWYECPCYVESCAIKENFEEHSFGDDNICTVCNYQKVEEPEECVHEYEGSKTYMDKETYIWYKDCSLCGEPVETAAVKNTTNLISHSLLFSDVVGDVVGINRASTGSSKGLTIQGYADYYFEVEYKRYGTGYVVENLVSDPFTSDKYTSQNASKTVDNFEFKSVSLTMMAEDFTVNLYLLDAEGDVVAVNSSTTSIQDRALAYAQRYSSDTLLLTALVDMVNYGATLQEYFAEKNPGTAIDGAALPTVGFEAYQDYATPVENLPEKFNSTETKEKVLASTGLLFGNTTLKIGATNTILTQLKTNGYDINNLEIYAYYRDYKNTLVEDRVKVSELGAPTTQGSATLYSYVFGKLKLAELETPVTFEVYNNGTLEYRYTYSIGVYANKYIVTADMKEVVQAMECFGMSARDKLYGVDA